MFNPSPSWLQKIFALSFLAFAEVHAAEVVAPSLKDERLCALFLIEIQRASLGQIQNPYSRVREEFGSDVVSRPTPFGIFEFESEIIQLFETAPELRDLESFAKKWGLKKSDITDYLTYYAIHIFDGELRVAGDLPKVFRRLQEVSRFHFLNFSDHPAAKRYGYYRINVTQKAVPEMAKELSEASGQSVSEGEVYRDLSRLGISIVDEFMKPDPTESRLSLVNRLIDSGISLSEAARMAGVGEQAVLFVRHATHESPRGVSWDRAAVFEEKYHSEDSILVTLHYRGFTRAMMAQELNRVFRASPSDPFYRTEASVQARLKDLGLTKKHEHGESEIYDPRYGYLKLEGRLVPAAVLNFLMDHYQQPNSFFSDFLDVTPQGLNDFFARHHIVRVGGGKFQLGSEKAKERLARYRQQIATAVSQVDPIWTKGRLPKGYWLDPIHVKAYLLWLGKELGYNKPEDWYQIDQDSIERNFGSRLLFYQGTNPAEWIPKFLQFDDFTWEPWKFPRVGKSFWGDSQKVQEYLTWLGDQLGFQKAEDWYGLTTVDLNAHNGGPLLNINGNSAVTIVTNYIHPPEGGWKPWRFTKVPERIWDNPETVREFLASLAQLKGIKSPEDWYQIRYDDIADHGGRTLVQKFGSAPEVVIANIPPPEGGWLRWKFLQVPAGYWDDPANLKSFLLWFAKRHNLETPEAWYGVSRRDFVNDKATGVALRFSADPISIVKVLHPDFDAKRELFRQIAIDLQTVSEGEEVHPHWLSDRVPHGFWNSEQNQRGYLKWLANKLGLKKPEDWYAITNDAIIENDGSGLLQNSYKSASTIIVKFIDPPVGGWRPWLFAQAPDGFWDDEKNQKEYLKWLGEILGFKKSEDWYGLTAQHLKKNAGHAFLKRYQNAPWKIVQSLIPPPEGGWLPWLFNQVPDRFWQNEDNARRFLSWAGEQLGYKTPDDWYNITHNQLSELGGTTLIFENQNSISEVVKRYIKFPDHEWLDWRFTQVGRNFWDKLENRRKYLSWLGEKLGFKGPEDWYRLTAKDLKANFGHTLMTRFEASPRKVVTQNLEPPPGGWLDWKFPVLGKGYWDDPAHLKSYLNWFASQRGLTKPEDWYQVKAEDFRKMNGGGVRMKFQEDPLAVLKTIYPDYSWDLRRFSTE